MQGKNPKVLFFRKIQFRLVISFLVPVVCIIVLGTVSYQKASSAIMNNYRTSTEQTANMMQQYLSLIITSEKDTFKFYVNEEDLISYYQGFFSGIEKASVMNTYLDEVRTSILNDPKVKSIYFLSDNKESLYTVTADVVEDAYSQYKNSSQGELVAENAYEWHVFGVNEELDAQVGLASGYSVRLVREFNKAPVIMVVDLDEPVIREILQSLDAGENSSIMLVTKDGKEFYSDSAMQSSTPLVYGTDFYNNAMAGEEIDGSRTVYISGKEYLFVYSRLSVGDAMIAALIPADRLLQETADIKMLSLILTLAAAVIALLLGTVISRRMSGTIQYILRQLHKVSAGDLTIHLKTKRKDEFGLLCAGINDTVNHVKSMIIQVNEVSTLLNSDASYVNDASQVFMETSSDIQKAVSEIEVGVERLDTGSEDCLSQMDMLSGKISNVSQNTDEISKLTTATGSTIGTGIESVQGLTSSAQQTSQITREVIEAIQELEKKSDSINKIVSAINDIAEQTNLLSLNASIEAARAGDAGRGFAVVAEEIRKLSDQCLTSAAQISEIVHEIADKTGQVVVIARQAEEIVSTQAGAVEETTSAFHLINDQVESLLKALHIISGSVQEIDASRTQTLGAIESISAVSAETAACSSSVHSTAGTQLDAVRDLENASNQLRERADRLMEVLGSFIVS